MNTSLTKFCRDHDLPKSSVYRRAQELHFDTSDGLTPEACDRLLHEVGVVVEQPETEPVEPDKQAVTIEVGNHQIVLSQPELPQPCSLESLRQSEVVTFDDPLAIAAQFLQTADVLTAEMQRDLRVREQKLQQTQQAKAAITEKFQPERWEPTNHRYRPSRRRVQRLMMLGFLSSTQPTRRAIALYNFNAIGIASSIGIHDGKSRSR